MYYKRYYAKWHFHVSFKWLATHFSLIGYVSWLAILWYYFYLLSLAAYPPSNGWRSKNIPESGAANTYTFYGNLSLIY